MARQPTISIPPTKYCDLVMKGGITSGIVYPSAVLALAKEFRFKNIGGTSAGAIAAAASAAAAMGDRKKAVGRQIAHEQHKVGFEGLAEVSKQLSTQGFIYSLFQPAWGLKNAYRLIVILAGNSGPIRKFFALLTAVITIAPIETMLILAAFLGLGLWTAGRQGLWAALFPSLLCAYAGGGLFSILRVARVARRNLLGLCSGLPRRRFLPKHFCGAPKPALTEWLHRVLQELSGKPVGEPLTFADLWSAERYDGEPSTAHAISLQMITTGVSHHEPRTLPFAGGSFFFLREEFDLLFPKAVVDWMVAKGGDPDEVAGKIYYRLPSGGDLPVLVGMRMSLSFPLLISAVPLHEPASRHRKTKAPAEDQATQDAAPDEKSLADSVEGLTTGGDRLASKITAFRVCWFSDGGISSNFPIHLFDAALPRWPTFAINLVYPKTDDTNRSVPEGVRTPEQQIEDAVFLPTENNQGWQRTYQPITRSIAAMEIASFLFGIIGTMQNWRDLLQSRAPGQRDRIVHVSLKGDEGGMNLSMTQDVLTRISEKGTVAGNRLTGFSFDNHHWIRWRSLASALQRYATKAAESGDCKPIIPAYAIAYETAKSGRPPPPSYKFSSRAKRAEAEKLLKSLTNIGRKWEVQGPDLTDGAPRPLPQVQITPTY